MASHLNIKNIFLSSLQEYLGGAIIYTAGIEDDLTAMPRLHKDDLELTDKTEISPLNEWLQKER